MQRLARTTAFCVAAITLAAAGCSDNAAIDSNEAARRAYLGLDGSIGKSLTLGFAGFNTASNANIDPQTAPGDADGTLTITGQVDQGASANKEMRLYVGMVGYTDGEITVQYDGGDVTVNLTYDTSDVQASQPYLHLALRNIPTGDFTGELTGDYHLQGDIDGDVTLSLTFAGTLQDDGAGGVERVPGATTVTGTATSGDGLYDVSLTL